MLKLILFFFLPPQPRSADANGIVSRSVCHISKNLSCRTEAIVSTHEVDTAVRKESEAARNVYVFDQVLNVTHNNIRVSAEAYIIAPLLKYRTVGFRVPHLSSSAVTRRKNTSLKLSIATLGDAGGLAVIMTRLRADICLADATLRRDYCY